MSGEARPAVHKRSWWPGWIWAIPIAALGIVAWLAVRSEAQQGPVVTVIFPGVSDLRADDTNVTFQGLTIGQVATVRLEPDLRHLRVTLRLHPDLAHHLGPGTKFWVIGKSFSLSNFSAVRSLITGVTVGIDPAPGPVQTIYHALAQAPEPGFGMAGTHYELDAASLGSIGRSTPVYFEGEKVGEVIGQSMQAPGHFTLRLFIDSPYDGLIHTGTRFWRAGPVELSTGSNGPELQFQSIPSLFQGAIAFETPPGKLGGEAAPPNQHFHLYGGHEAAENAPDADGVAYSVVFPEASGVPGENAPVTLMGKRVGSVSQSALRYDPAAGKLTVEATIVLERRDIGLDQPGGWGEGRAAMDAMMRTLIGQGLRAELSSSPPVIGGQLVALALVPGQSGGTLEPGNPPQIPVEAGGGGMAGVMSGADALLAKLDALPLAHIADNLRDISRHAAKLASSPALAGALRGLDRSSENLERITRDMRRQLPSTLDRLRQAMGEAQESLASAHDLLAAQGNAASAPDSAALPQTLYEITRAARSLRELTSYLDRHPGSLLTGRGAGQ